MLGNKLGATVGGSLGSILGLRLGLELARGLGLKLGTSVEGKALGELLGLAVVGVAEIEFSSSPRAFLSRALVHAGGPSTSDKTLQLTGCSTR